MVHCVFLYRKDINFIVKKKINKYNNIVTMSNNNFTIILDSKEYKISFFNNGSQKNLKLSLNSKKKKITIK